ncbi:MAG: pyruvate dehydrogenase (acetyl-transferring), homodimeric type, partial [Sphaerochaetaceae bacterium]
MINDKIYHDPDPQETKDWLESLEGVIKNEGPEKADLLLNELTDSARNLGVNTSPGVISPYVNSPLHNGEVSLPADDSIVAKNVAALVRWNAMAMVAKANKKDHSIGGHIASFASSSAIYEVGFNWFFKGPDSP